MWKLALLLVLNLSDLREMCSQGRLDEAVAEVRRLVAETEDPIVIGSIANSPESRELLRRPEWPALQETYFARLDAASAQRHDLGYEFICRGIKDQWMRFYVIANPGQALSFAEIDKDNIARLKAVVAEQGWPRQSVWGRQAANSAWMILQHSPDTEFQAQMLPLMEKLLAEKECSGPEYALLYDRVQLRHGKPQRYGSQVARNSEGHWEPAEPLEDPDHLDERRAAVGLNPIDEYLEGCARMYDQR